MNNLDDFVKVDEEYEDIDPNKLVICRCFSLHTKCLMKCVVFFTCENMSRNLLTCETVCLVAYKDA